MALIFPCGLALVFYLRHVSIGNITEVEREFKTGKLGVVLNLLVLVLYSNLRACTFFQTEDIL